MELLTKCFLLCVLLVTAGCLASTADEDITIAKILSDPERYNGSTIDLRGVISRSPINYAPSGFRFYWLRINDSTGVADLYQNGSQLTCSARGRIRRSDNGSWGCNTELIVGAQYNVSGAVSFYSVYLDIDGSRTEHPRAEIHLLSQKFDGVR